ncbi:MEE40 [Symbiodinium microadriaticum]|nr:MEE40 [Symbiodinium microadriaticum]
MSEPGAYLDRVLYPDLLGEQLVLAKPISEAAAPAWRRGLGALQRLARGRVSPDLVGFNAALSACILDLVCLTGERRSRWPLAVCLAGEKASTDAVTCNVLLSAAVRISWQRALATVEGIQPDSVTYNTAAHALCKADQDQQLGWLQASMKLKFGGIRPGKVSFAALAAVARRRRHWCQALYLLHCMEAEQVEADAVSCALALRCLEDCSEWSWAMLLLQRPGLDSTCLNVALSAVLAGAEAPWHRGLCLVASALQHGPAPDSVSCSTVASACARAAVPGVAHRLLRTLQFSGVRLGTSAYNAFLASSRFHWSLAMATFEEMGEKAENALSRDTITLGAAVAALSADSTAWAKAMYFQRHRLNAPATTACSTACSNAGEWGRALAVLSKLAQSGLQEDQKTRTAAVAAGGCQGWRASLEKLGQEQEKLQKHVSLSADTLSSRQKQRHKKRDHIFQGIIYGQPKHPLFMRAIAHAFSKEIFTKIANLEYMIFCKALWKFLRDDMKQEPAVGWNISPTYGPVYLLQELNSQALRAKGDMGNDGHYFVTKENITVAYTRCWDWQKGFKGDPRASERSNHEGALPGGELISDDVQASITNNSFEEIMEAVKQEKHYGGISSEDVMRCIPRGMILHPTTRLLSRARPPALPRPTMADVRKIIETFTESSGKAQAPLKRSEAVVGARMTLDAISANAAVAACRSVWQNALYLLSGQVQLDASSSELAAVAAEASQQGTAVAMLLHDLEGRVEELLRR